METVFTREQFDALMAVMADSAAEARERGEASDLPGYTKDGSFSFVVVVDAGQAAIAAWAGDVIERLVTNGDASIDTCCWRSPPVD